MARLIKTGDTPAKKRHAHMRSCAEALRLLAKRSAFDDEARDMTAFVVFNLRGIYATIDDSAQVWEERRYWKKAEALRETWRWSHTAADRLERLVLADQWDRVVPLLLELVPRFNGITISSITRNADWWCGALRALKEEAAATENRD